MKFEYKDNSKLYWVKDKDKNKDALYGHYEAPVIFSCEAPSLTEADKLFLEKMGYSPQKKHIGV